jgi:methylated-DNA-protein-cysteine methyltransferase-like protein
MENIFAQVYGLVARIPFGRVCTYGQLARLLGDPRLSRAVGYALHAAPAHFALSRVVNRFGGLSDAFLPAGRRPTHAAGVGGRHLRRGGPGGAGQYMWYGE